MSGNFQGTRNLEEFEFVSDEVNVASPYVVQMMIWRLAPVYLQEVVYFQVATCR